MLEIDEPELKKASDVPCQHMIEKKGCSIHKTSPPLCQNWYCGWRMVAAATDAMRPDKSGVLIYPKKCTETGYPEVALKFSLLSNVRQILNPEIVNMVGFCVANGIPAYLSLHVAKAEGFATFLNEHLAAAEKAKDGAAMVGIMISMLEEQVRLIEKSVREKEGRAS